MELPMTDLQFFQTPVSHGFSPGSVARMANVLLACSSLGDAGLMVPIEIRGI